MRLRYLYILIIYSILTLVVNSQELLSESKTRGISSINSEIELKKSQIMELENLKKSILKTKKNNKNLKVGLALSGGGAKGFAHIGVLKVLEENNITIDYISGTSMGAIVASLYAVGYSPDEIEVIIKTMDWKYRLSNEPIRRDIPLDERFKSEKYIASMTYDKKFNFYFPKGVLKGEKSYLKLKELFWEENGEVDFNKFYPKLRIVATDYNTGIAKTFDHGDLAHIISASMAIPSVYDPVRIDDNVYIDGMVSRNLPVEDLFEAGADIVIASDVGAPLEAESQYNVFTIVRKITSYRGVEKTEEQRNLATVIIDPDVKLNDPSNFNNFNDSISKGEKATHEKMKEIKQFDIANLKKRKRKKIDTDKVLIEKIELTNAKILLPETVKNNLDTKIPGMVGYKDLEKLMMKLYALPYIEKSYYTISGTTLKISVDENEPNHVRVGVNYNSDLGAKLAIGTDLTKVGGIGRITSLEAELGEFNSVEFNNFWYYGDKNKIGINLSFGYDENPLFFYRERALKAESKEEIKYIDLNLNTRLFMQFDITGGIRYISLKNKLVVGTEDSENLIDEKYDYQEIYFSLLLDRKNYSIYPTNGSYIEFKHEGGGVATDNVEYYSELGVAEGYLALTPRLSLNASISGGIIDGAKIPLGSNFKIGGINSDFSNNYIEFYGYEVMRKLASEFMIGQVGLQYRIFDNIYLLMKANVLTYTGIEDGSTLVEESLMFDDYKYGYGVTVGYKSLFGPIELSVTNDADTVNSYIITVNMGYVF